jgi:hypothetical protein
MHSDLDVLLPRIGPAAGTEFFFTVTVTDEIRGEAITRRVRERLAGCDLERELTYSVSYRLLRPANRNANELMEDFVERIDMSIQELVDDVISPKVSKNEQ